jgi:GTP cyclohydrolase I
MARGVRDHNATMKVDVMRGLFKEDESLRNELLSRVSRGRKDLV